MLPLLTEDYGNPSGAHAIARQARTALDGARRSLASVVGCEPGEVVFTSGGTEADNLAVRGIARCPRRHGGVQRRRAPRRPRARHPRRRPHGRGRPSRRRRPRRAGRGARRRRRAGVGGARQQRDRHGAAAARDRRGRPRAGAGCTAAHRCVAGALVARPARARGAGRPGHAGLAQVRRAEGHRRADRAGRRQGAGAAGGRRPGAGPPQRHPARGGSRGLRGGGRAGRRASGTTSGRVRTVGGVGWWPQSWRASTVPSTAARRRTATRATSCPGSPTCACPRSTARPCCSCSSTTTGCWPRRGRAARAARRSPRTCSRPSASTAPWRAGSVRLSLGWSSTRGRRRRRHRRGARRGRPPADPRP